MADRWDHVARLLALHGEVCAALALLRTRVEAADRRLLDDLAAREAQLAAHLEVLARDRGAPRDLRTAARRHLETLDELFA